MAIQVIKRDGTLEEFEKEKIERVVAAAGLADDQAKNLANKIAAWLESAGKQQVTTLQIRNRVVSELQKINQFAYNAFVWYGKTKDHGLNSGESV